MKRYFQGNLQAEIVVCIQFQHMINKLKLETYCKCLEILD